VGPMFGASLAIEFPGFDGPGIKEGCLDEIKT
jgi:hypothetical protein